MDRWLLSFFLGAILALFAPVVPELFYQTLLILNAVLFLVIKKWRTGLAFILGLLWLLHHGAQYQQSWPMLSQDDESFHRKAHQVIAVIDNMPKQETDRLRFNALIEQIDGRLLPKPIKVRLSWKNPTQLLRQGNRVLAKVKLKPAHGFANPGGFNYQRWLKANHIAATGYLLSKSELEVINDEQTVRQQLLINFQQYLPNNQNSLAKALMPALSFGERSQFTPEIWQVLNQSGTQHLVAISGLHIGLIFLVSLFALKILLTILPLALMPVHLRLKIQTINLSPWLLLVSLTIAIFYSYLANFAVPTVRAIIMLSWFVGARLIKINLPLHRWLLLTLASITLVMPFSLFSASFWLSFIAVITIFWLLWRFKQHFSSRFSYVNNSAVQRIFSYLKSLVLLQLGLSLLLMPITALNYGQVSFISVLANFIALPVMSLVIIPLCLLALIASLFSQALTSVLIQLTEQLLSIVWHYLLWLCDFSWAIISVSYQTTLVICLLVFALIMLISLVSVNLSAARRYLALIMTPLTQRRSFCLIAAMLLFFTLSFTGINQPFSASLALDNQQKTTGNWWLYVLDVGQGLAVVVKKNERVLVYDTGADFSLNTKHVSANTDKNVKADVSDNSVSKAMLKPSSNTGFNLAKAVIVPFLQHQNIEEIDYLVISHNDNDHAGGLAVLLEYFPVKQLIYNQKVPLNLLNANTNKHQQSVQQSPCLAGKVINLQGITIKTLSPETVLADDNDDSCVLQLTDGSHSLLLTGDISRSVEKKLQQQYPELRADIVIAPHHGSKTSSSKAFIKWLSPKYVAFSAGFLNRWNMPNPEVVSRYQEQRVVQFSTAESGMITFKLSPSAIEAISYRDHISPYWIDN